MRCECVYDDEWGWIEISSKEEHNGLESIKVESWCDGTPIWGELAGSLKIGVDWIGHVIVWPWKLPVSEIITAIIEDSRAGGVSWCLRIEARWSGLYSPRVDYDKRLLADAWQMLGKVYPHHQGDQLRDLLFCSILSLVKEIVAYWSWIIEVMACEGWHFLLDPYFYHVLFLRQSEVLGQAILSNRTPNIMSNGICTKMTTFE